MPFIEQDNEDPIHRYHAVKQQRIHYFHHSQLPDPGKYVRLLRFSINPVHGDYEYNLEIFPVARLFDPPEQLTYYAVSYEWGSSKSLKTIVVNSQRLSIRENLYDFLHRIQTKIRAGTFHSDYWLWIDAICINQWDSDEKAAQIPLMQRIFSNAKNVFAWLGSGGCFDAQDFKQNILDVTDGIYDRSYSRLDSTPKIGHLACSPRQKFALRKVAELLQTDFYDELILVLSLSFWSRRWILQEICLAWSVIMMCGDIEFRWSDMKSLFCLLRSHFQHQDHNPLQKYLAWRLWELENASLIKPELDVDYLHQLRTILAAFMGSECELDIDRIYVVINLMSSQSLVVPDYTYSKTRLFCSIYVKGAHIDLDSLMSSSSVKPTTSAELRRRVHDCLIVAQELRLEGLGNQNPPKLRSLPSAVRYSQLMQYVQNFSFEENDQMGSLPPFLELKVTTQSVGLEKVLSASEIQVVIGPRSCCYQVACAKTMEHGSIVTLTHEDDERGQTLQVLTTGSSEAPEQTSDQVCMDPTVFTYRFSNEGV